MKIFDDCIICGLSIWPKLGKTLQLNSEEPWMGMYWDRDKNQKSYDICPDCAEFVEIKHYTSKDIKNYLEKKAKA